jgi:hypothetical protein
MSLIDGDRVSRIQGRAIELAYLETFVLLAMNFHTAVANVTLQ